MGELSRQSGTREKLDRDSGGRRRKRGSPQMDAAAGASASDRSYTIEVDGTTYTAYRNEPPPQLYYFDVPVEDDDDVSWGLRVPAVPERVDEFFARVDPEGRFTRRSRPAWREDQQEEGPYNKRARVPASSKAIQGLQVVTPGAALQAECAVCLQDFHPDHDKLRALPCSHAFHEHCIFDWLKVSHVCPLCRHALPTQQPGEEEEYQPASRPVPQEA
ncbi:hypothetical protein EJB05_29641, partial [Eragrostis curvula]